MMDLLDKVRLWINVLYRFKNLFDEMPYSTVPKSLILKYQDLNGLYLKGKQGQTGEWSDIKVTLSLFGGWFLYLLFFLAYYTHLYYDVSIANYSYLSFCFSPLDCKIIQIREPYLFISGTSVSNENAWHI